MNSLRSIGGAREFSIGAETISEHDLTFQLSSSECQSLTSLFRGLTETDQGVDRGGIVYVEPDRLAVALGCARNISRCGMKGARNGVGG